MFAIFFVMVLFAMMSVMVLFAEVLFGIATIFVIFLISNENLKFSKGKEGSFMNYLIMYSFYYCKTTVSLCLSIKK